MGDEGHYGAEGRFLPLVALVDPVLSPNQGPQKTAWYRSNCAGLALALLLATPTPGSVENRLEIELAWGAPVTCAESDDVRLDVRRILGRSLVPSELPPIVARAVLTPRKNGGYVLALRTTAGDRERERSVEVDDCQQARDLVAFLLAMLVDPKLRSSGSPESELEANAAKMGAGTRAKSALRKPEPSGQLRDASSIPTEQEAAASVVNVLVDTSSGLCRFDEQSVWTAVHGKS